VRRARNALIKSLKLFKYVIVFSRKLTAFRANVDCDGAEDERANNASLMEIYQILTDNIGKVLLTKTELETLVSFVQLHVK
jgi:hypothetical protein